MNNKRLHFTLIALVGLLVYSNTLESPFVLDDRSYILENPFIKDINYFTDSTSLESFSEKLDGPMTKGVFKRRLLSFLSFAFNYRLNGIDPTGYHVVDITLHILNACLLYLLILLTLRTPRMSGTWLKAYISQRFVILATCLCLLSLVFYAKWRLNKEIMLRKAINHQRFFSDNLLLYCVALLFAALAMKAKEIAFTLPVLVALYEFTFFEGPAIKRALRILPFAFTMLIIPFSLFSEIEIVLKDLRAVHPMYYYIITQFCVIATYVRLIFLPVGQNLDYDYPAYNSFFEPSVFLSFLFLLAIFGLGIYLFRRSRFANQSSLLVAFGIFWFFITLSVESSVMPITDVIFEHRVYLPSVGAFIALATGTLALLDKFAERKSRNAVVLFLVLIVITLSSMAHLRNGIWKSKISLWEDVVKKSPNKPRGHINLGTAYGDEGMADKAIEHFMIALNLDPGYTDAHNNIAAVYGDIGMTDKAIEHLKTVLELEPSYAEAYNNLGTAYLAKGNSDIAIEYYRNAIRLKPNYAKAYNNLGLAYMSEDLIDKAIQQYRTAIRLRPDAAEAHNNLAVALGTKGITNKVIDHLQAAIDLRPDYVKAHFNLGISYLMTGWADAAEMEFKIVLELNPNHGEARLLLETLKNNTIGQ
jgi:tetratricopeptide (TPR) repeat protein